MTPTRIGIARSTVNGPDLEGSRIMSMAPAGNPVIE
jgi:hypothetical protein